MVKSARSLELPEGPQKGDPGPEVGFSSMHRHRGRSPIPAPQKESPGKLGEPTHRRAQTQFHCTIKTTRDSFQGLEGHTQSQLTLAQGSKQCLPIFFYRPSISQPWNVCTDILYICSYTECVFVLYTKRTRFS